MMITNTKDMSKTTQNSISTTGTMSTDFSYISTITGTIDQAMNLKRNFALIGAAGYIAARHMQAIRDTGHRLACALDPFDVMGRIDSYFPEAAFFTEPERFDRHLDNRRRRGREAIDYVSICSPNYLHDAHIRMALRNDCDVICEKPMVINPWNLDALETIEQESGKRINTILQLRLHPAIVALKRMVDQSPPDMKFDVDLKYITPRGKWYQYSWKGNEEKSGGLMTNIGIHFFDMLLWIFGSVIDKRVYFNTPTNVQGRLVLERADVQWRLSIEGIPERSLVVNNQVIDFTAGFTDLHTLSYEKILDGDGFGIADARPSIELVHTLRQ